MDEHGKTSSKNHPKSPRFQLPTTFGEGVKITISIFGGDFWHKKKVGGIMLSGLEDIAVWARKTLLSGLEHIAVWARTHCCSR